MIINECGTYSFSTFRISPSIHNLHYWMVLFVQMYFEFGEMFYEIGMATRKEADFINYQTNRTIDFIQQKQYLQAFLVRLLAFGNTGSLYSIFLVTGI